MKASAAPSMSGCDRRGPPATERPPTERRDTAIGVLLALAIIAGWLTVHVNAVFAWHWSPLSAVSAPLVIMLQSWLGAGLVIIAHDAIHGSLAPIWPRLSMRLGSVALLLYAAFDYDRLRAAHLDHHRFAGTTRDPDFDDRPRPGFWSWYLCFMRRNLTVRQFGMLAVAVIVWVTLLGAPVVELLLFWAVPALLSSLQLFRWGTYLPHRPGRLPFADRHRARDDQRGVACTLLTCFHFGLHHRHHLHPRTPWWALPRAGRARRLDQGAKHVSSRG